MDIDEEIEFIESIAVMVGFTTYGLSGTKLERVLRPGLDKYVELAPGEPRTWWRLSLGGMDEPLFSVTKKTIEEAIMEARSQLTDLNAQQIKAAKGNRKKSKKAKEKK